MKALDLVNQHLSFNSLRTSNFFDLGVGSFSPIYPNSHSLVSQQVRCPFG